MSKLTDTRKETTKTIKHGDRIILLEYSENIIYVLLATREMESISYFLNKVKEQFNDYYKSILKDLTSVKGIEEDFFSSFDEILNDILNNR